MTRALLIPVEGEVTEVQLADDHDDFNLAELQRLVGGYIELVWAPDLNVNVYLNEDGKRMHLAPNPRAQKVLAHAGLAPYDVVVGPAVVTGYNRYGEDGDLTDEQVAAVRERIASHPDPEHVRHKAVKAWAMADKRGRLADEVERGEHRDDDYDEEA